MLILNLCSLLFFYFSVNTLRDTSTMSQTNRRQLDKLQRLLAINEAQYQIVNKQIDSFWSSHQQNVKQNQRLESTYRK